MVVSVGIDVSKDKHDCFIVSSEGEVLADAFISPACSAFACAFWYLSFLLPAFSAEPSGSCALPVSCGPPASSSCLMRSEGRLFRLSS